MTLKNDAKFEEKLAWGLKFGKFSAEHLKVSKLGLRRGPFLQSRKCMNLRFTEEFCVMTMKNDTKFEEELTCHFKIDMSNLTNLTRALGNLKNLRFNLLLWPTCIMFELKSTEELCLMTLKIDTKFEGKLTCAFKNDFRNLANFHMLKEMNSTFNKTFYTLNRIVVLKV